MKNFILVIIISFIFSSISFAEWIEVFRTTEVVHYIDPDKVKTRGSTRFYWHLMDFMVPIENGDLSMKAYIHAECDLGQIKMLKYARYALSMGEGSATSIFSNPEEKWEIVKTGTVFSTSFNYVCSR